MNQNTAESTNDNEPTELLGKKLKGNLARQVPVKLTEHELAQRGKGASEAAIELQKLKSTAKEVAARNKERIDEKQAELDKLLDTLGSGFEDRIVTCQERFHAGTVLTIREDTWEVVGSPRPARPDERQIAMPNSGGGNILTEAAQKQTSFPDDEEEEKPAEPFNPPKKRASKKKANGATEES